MTGRIALMGKAKAAEEMDRHLQLLQDAPCRPHIDAWTHAVSQRKEAALQEEIRRHGYFWLAVETGRVVRWWVKVTDAVFLREGIDRWYDGVHDSVYDKPARTLLVYSEGRREERVRNTFRAYDSGERVSDHPRVGTGTFVYVRVDWE